MEHGKNELEKLILEFKNMDSEEYLELFNEVEQRSYSFIMDFSIETTLNFSSTFKQAIDPSIYTLLNYSPSEFVSDNSLKIDPDQNRAA